MRTRAAGIVLAAGLAACSPEAERPKTAQAPASDASPEAAEPAPGKYKEIDFPGAAKDSATPFRSDTVDVVVQPQGAPGDKLEYKIRMKAGETLTYDWEARDAKAFWHEFHGHTADTVSFYKKAEGVKHAGSLVAPFEGVHGWYFENRTPNQVVVRLRMGGFYELDRTDAD